MQGCNPIIIPVVRSRPTHEELNIFQPSELCLTPTKDAPISRALVDRKWGSAFKRYKLKKEKKSENHDPSNQQSPSSNTIIRHRPLKIKIINVDQEAINKSKFHFQDILTPIVYYDPNQAPLYWQDSEQYCLQDNPQLIVPIKTQRMDEQLQIQVQQKVKNEPMEEEFQQKFIEAPSFQTDPFIIMKRAMVKKNKTPRSQTNLIKAKMIMKAIPNSEKKQKSKINNIHFMPEQKRNSNYMHEIEEKQEDCNLKSSLFKTSISKIMVSQGEKMTSVGDYIATLSIFINTAQQKYKIANQKVSSSIMASEEMIR